MTTASRPTHAPGPRSLSPMGDISAIRRDPLGVFMESTREYGDIVRFRGGPWFAHLVVHPDHVKHVLQDNHQNYHKGFEYGFLKPVVGEGLLTSEDDFWLRQRRLAQPAFHRQRLAAFATIMTEAAASMLERWRPLADEARPLDVSSEMMRLTLEIVGRTLLSSDVSGETDTVGQAVTVLREHVDYRSMRLFTPAEWVPTPRNRRFRRAMRGLDALVYGMIDQRRRTGEDTGDLLSMLLLARDEETGESMSDRQLRDEVMTVFLAGHETTAIALTWTWYLLAQHPAAEEQLHDELSRVLDGRPPAVEDLPNLTYTRMVTEESLRLYPPAWSIARRSIKPDEIGGYRIPGSSEVILSPYVTHRHPAFWEEPDAFDPERFAPERAAGRPRYAYFPFGGGPRQCIGNEFALMEAQLVLATVAQAYRLRLAPGHAVEPEPLISLRPRGGLPMTLHRRGEQARGAA